MNRLRIFSIMLCITLGVVGFISPRETMAEEEQTMTEITPPRLSFIDGRVSFWRPKDIKWEPARVNTPIAAGDELSIGQSGNLELQMGTGAYLRAAANTHIRLEDHQPDFIRFLVSKGHVSLDTRSFDPGRSVEIDTPNATFVIEHSGYYRLDVDGNYATFSVYRSGKAVVVLSRDEEFTLASNQVIRLEEGKTPRFDFYMHEKHSVVVVKKSDFAHGPVKHLRVPPSKSGFGFGPTPQRPTSRSSGSKRDFATDKERGRKPPNETVKRSGVPPKQSVRHIEQSARGQQFLHQTDSNYGLLPRGLIVPEQRVEKKQERMRKDTVKPSAGNSEPVVPKSISVQRGKSSSDQMLRRRPIPDSQHLEVLPLQNQPLPSHRKGELPP